MKQLKLYMMLGLPGETDADIDELGRFSLELSRDRAARSCWGSRRSSPSATPRSTARRSRRSTSIDEKLARLRAAVKGRVTLRPDLAQVGLDRVPAGAGGDRPAGRAAARAARAGGRFADWKAALADVPAPAARSRRADPQLPSTAMASISIRAPLGRPAA